MPENFGDAFVSSLLAGMKFKALDEDLKLSRLQRLDYEQNKAHRENMSALEEQLGQSRLAREQVGMGIDRLTQHQLEMQAANAQADRPLEQQLLKSRTSEAGTRAKAAKFDLSSAQKDRGYLEAKQSQDLATGATVGQTKSLELARAIGGNSSVLPSIADATQIVAGLGVKDDSAKAIMTQAVMSGAEDKQREIAANKHVLQQQALEEFGKTVDLARGVAANGDAYTQAVGTVLGEDHPVYQIAKRAVGTLPETSRTMTPFEIADSQQLAKELKDLSTSIQAEQSNLDEIKGGKHTYIVGSRSGAIEKSKAKIADLKAQQAELRSSSPGAGSIKAPSMDAEKFLADNNFKIDPKADDKTLNQIVSYLKDQGIVVDIATLKKIRDRK